MQVIHITHCITDGMRFDIFDTKHAHICLSLYTFSGQIYACISEKLILIDTYLSVYIIWDNLKQFTYHPWYSFNRGYLKIRSYT